MKLRNKKTGEIVDFQPFQFYQTDDCKYPSDIFESLSDLNDEWEDYIPKEPLIKEEKIRKAVRAWAEINTISQVTYVTDSSSCRLCDMNDVHCIIDFVGWIPTLKDCGEYFITELCGEEEK